MVLKDISVFRRFAVVGAGGSGKTTFASALAKYLNIKHIELDSIYWLPDWKAREKDDFYEKAREAITACDSWITDGNYLALRELIWNEAEVLIWLNYSFRLTLFRILKRTVIRVFSRKLLFSGNRESFRQSFLSRNSIIWYVIKTFHGKRKEYNRVFSENHFPHLIVLEFKSPQETEKFLSDLAYSSH